MRIVQILPELNEGGVERGTVELSRELVKNMHESIVISSGGKLVKQIVSSGAKHIALDVSSKNIFTAIFRIFKLKKVLKELNPDVVHARSRVPAWLVYFANRGLKIPFVTTVHGFNSVNFYSKIMTYGDAVICVSNSIREHIQKHYDIQEEKITVIARGVDLENFNPKTIDNNFIKEFVQKHALAGKIVISNIGRITQLKDLESFINAIYLLKKEQNNIVGLIVGSVHEDKKTYYKNLLELIKSLALEQNIIFTGSQTKIAEIYTLSDVVVSSSKKPESFGRSVAEAIAMNTPVVATRHGGVLDIVKDGENGYLTKIEDSKDLKEKIIKAKGLKFNGFEYISEHFSLEKMFASTVSVYEDL